MTALAPGRDAWPLPAPGGEGSPWETGSCWLYCRRQGVRVLQVESVRVPGVTGDAYACGPCIAELDHMVRAQADEREAALPLSRAPLGRAPLSRAPGCTHQRVTRHGGVTYCRDCARQLYL